MDVVEPNTFRGDKVLTVQKNGQCKGCKRGVYRVLVEGLSGYGRAWWPSDVRGRDIIEHHCDAA
jgi:hypothetical protein